jgi:hypothetical protein
MTAVLRLRINLKRRIVMRGALLIGLTIVLLIIGILVMKNMGVDNSTGTTERQALTHAKRAESAADKANERIRDLTNRVSGAK